MFARVLVILFAVVVVAVGGAIGYFVLGDSNSILNSGVGQLADPLAPVDPQDSTKQVVTVPPGATAASIGTTLQQRGMVRSAIVFRLTAEQAGVVEAGCRRPLAAAKRVEVAARPGADSGVDRRTRSQTACRTIDHRRRLSQSSGGQHAFAGRPHRPIRTGESRRPRRQRLQLL